VLTNRKELFTQAKEYYEKAVETSPANFESWLNLAHTYRHLYDLKSTPENFKAADECFARAAELDSQQITVWLRWSELYIADGKVKRDLNKIKASFEKFEKGDLCEGDHPLLLAKWADALLMVAGFEENYALLCEAEAKIIKALAGMPEDPNVWHIYGKCL